MVLPESYQDDYPKTITFFINDKNYRICSGDVPLDTSLNTYIREYAFLTGTKFMCKEGGCGSCVVVVKSLNLFTNKYESYAVNSCLLKIWSCDKYRITTIEKAKNFVYKDSKRTLSDQLASNNGSQCGYCSPGMVMNMYGLIQSNQTSEQDVESGFAGNICRCTGYAPILNAWRTLVQPSTNGLDSCIQDIEDSSCATACPMRRMRCNSSDDEDEDSLESSFLEFALPSPRLKLVFKNKQSWYQIKSLKELFELFDTVDSNYMLINGDTAQGVSPELFRDAPVSTYIDVSRIPELKKKPMNGNFPSDGFEVGGNLTLTDFISVLNDAGSNPLYKYAKELRDHLLLVANVPVRNIGTIAGNLMIKYKMSRLQPPLMFQSDVFLLLATVGATISIMERSNITTKHNLVDFLNNPIVDMNKKVITSIFLPSHDSKTCSIRTYKIMPRTQNAPAAVNAGFLFEFTNSQKTVVKSATIVYGGINASFVHATNTEIYLATKDITQETVLKDALNHLQTDIQLKDVTTRPPPITPPEYRRQLAFNLFYKTVLYWNRNVNTRYQLGARKLMSTRSLSTAREKSQIPQDGVWGKQIPKIEAYLQCRGEAQYINDIPVIHDQLYGALVIAPRGPGELLNESALKNICAGMDGVVTFLTTSDIPASGSSNMFLSTIFTPEYEDLFCFNNNVLHAGQPIGILVAETQDLAIKAARIITKQVQIMPKGNPLISIDSVLEKYHNKIPNDRVIVTETPIYSSQQLNLKADVKTKEEINEDVLTVNGEIELGSQYHYSMELQTCVVVPIEDGQLDVYSSTQWPFVIQRAISKVIGLAENKINLVVRRVGGAYGCKITRSASTACACALAAHNLKRPVRMVLDLETNMKAIGKRCAVKCNYEVVANKSTGKIVSINYIQILDNKGITLNDPIYFNIADGVINCYDIDSLLKHKLSLYGVKTDTPTTSWCRAPGILEGVFSIESIMERIAAECRLDPSLVRLNNLVLPQPDSGINSYITEKMNDDSFKQWRSDVNKFNKDNRWVKQGLSIIPLTFKINFYLEFFCTVSVCAGDGSISIAHGGCEIGQGINTKVAVAAAYVFGFTDLSNIQVKPTNLIYCPNNSLTGASMASDSSSYACMRASKIIKARLDKVKLDFNLPTDISWQDLINTAYAHDVDLNATYMWTIGDPGDPADPDIGVLKQYSVNCVCGSLVEVDILTGEHIVRKVLIHEDVGGSAAPLVDIGQIQGAFVMGLGYFTSEQLVYSSSTGELLTNRTWNYDPPGAKDIPENFIINVENEGKRIAGGVRGAKATGEPPLCLSMSVFFAIKEALKSARQETGDSANYFDFNPPATAAKIGLASETRATQFNITSP